MLKFPRHRQYRNRKINDDFGPGVGWPRADYLLGYSIKSNIYIFLFFMLFGIFVDDNMKKLGSKRFL